MSAVTDRITAANGLAAAIGAFATQPLPVAVAAFFTTLGYSSKRRMSFPSRAAFLADFASSNPDFATRFPDLATSGSAAIFLQQLTNDEITGNSSGQLDLLASDTADLRKIDSYLFVAFPLSSATYTHTDLSALARALNSLFAQPVLVLFHHGEFLSLAITNRRRSKTDASRDVVERKVTLIREIHIAHPHPGHLAILEDFSLPAIARARQRDIRTFADLDDAWRDSISTSLLTKRFYREISNWYFWARDHATFPKDAKPDADGKHSLQLIRLLTRLLFCWFLREKTDPKTGRRILPDDLFDEPRIRELLRDTSPEASTYYLAILQNLFFATLNTPQEDEQSRPIRKFIEEAEEEADDPSDVHGIQHFWRHQKTLRDIPRFETLFRNIPFLNGGLFECLDEILTNKAGRKTGERRIDGFSVKPSKQPHLPNFLFFGPPQKDVNLADAYGDSARQHETVRPLLEIFRHYKFTLTENTPLDEEVALDPDLLGHVFENLLAAYNPETGTIARKATGSFYTPDVAVDWMVDQALLVYLEEQLLAAHPKTTKTIARLRDLLSWETTTHTFTSAEVETLIDAIHRLRALDPACGSGAFPMGLLQKLVMVLRTLDPRNKLWRARNLADAQAITSAPAREAALKAIERAFAHDDDNYGRKLYLIERCIFGVDIQPIATQIAKLRLFLSLVVDQQIDPTERNYGILPLPNLETKIVAANTLLGLKRGQLLLGSDEVSALEEQLKAVRHSYFTARSYAQKKALKAQDADLRERLATALVDSGECTPTDARRLADWNPYDQNTFAPFFEPGWMFGRLRPGNKSEDTDRFDLVLGNPPYVRQEELKSNTVHDSAGRARPFKDVLKEQYVCYTGTADLYVYFFERSFQLLRRGGTLSFICSNKFFRSGYGERLRTFFLYATRVRLILDFGDAPVFTAIAYPSIFVAQKTRHPDIDEAPLPSAETLKNKDLFKQLIVDRENEVRVLNWPVGARIGDFPAIFEEQSFALAQGELRTDGWRFDSSAGLKLMDRLRVQPTLEQHCKDRIYRGVLTGLNEAFVVSRETRDQLIAEHKSSAEILKPFLRGRDVKRWRTEPEDLWLVFTRRGIDIKKYPAIHAYLKPFKKALTPGGAGGRKPGSYEWYEIQDNIAYWQEFSHPKIIGPAITDTVNYAPDFAGLFCNNKATIFIPPSVPYALAVANSSVSAWFARQRFATKQGGFYDFEPRYSSTTPIPVATDTQTQWTSRLSEYLIWLHSPDAPSLDASTGLLTAYFEQWLNGLVYELFFPSELNARRLFLFAETAKLAPPALATLKKSDRLSSLKKLFARAYEGDAPLRAMLFSLKSLEEVRIIESETETESSGNSPTDD